MMSRAQAITTYGRQAMEMVEALDNLGLGAFMQAECADKPFLRRHPWGQLFRCWWRQQGGEKLDEHGGATRIVYAREGCPLVLKIPTTKCCHEESYLPQCEDYCEREAALYSTICADYPNAADCFAGCWHIGDYDTARTYVRANWRDIASSDIYRLNKEAYTGEDEDNYGYHLFDVRPQSRYTPNAYICSRAMGRAQIRSGY